MSNKKFIYEHRYSSVKDKAPSASTLMTGEIAVNGNAEKPQLFIKDSSGDVRSFYSDYFQEVTQAQYDQMVEEGTIDPRIMYIITDSEPLDASKFVTSGSVVENESAYTLSFSGESIGLFDLEIPKGEGKTYSAGTSITIDSANTISVVVDNALDSGSTNPVANSALTEALDNKLDKVNFINNLYPKGSVYITYENKNPSEFLGGTWELIGGQDENLVFYPAFAIDTDTAGTTINESLPNITGKFSAYDYAGGWHDGATSTRQTLNPRANAGGSETPWIGYTFNASTSNSTYQDGAQVNVNAIKLFHWRRTDDGTIVEQITPLDVDVEDVLWQGTQGAATNVNITLSDSFGDYKYLKFYSRKDENNMVDNVDVKDINVTTSSLEIIKEHGWDSALRYFRFHKTSDTTFEMDLVDLTLYKIVGVRTTAKAEISAGDGIQINNGEVSVAPLQKVTCTKTSLIGNEFYFGGEYYPALKTVHIHGGFAPTTSIGNGSGICRLTIGSQQVVFDDNVIGYVMCNNNATYMKFCQSAKDTNQITARDLTIDTGRFYWCDLICPAHLE